MKLDDKKVKIYIKLDLGFASLETKYRRKMN